MKKIILFNTLYYPYILGGAEKSTQLLAETLVKSGYKVIVVSTGKENKEKVINGVKIYYVYIPNIFWRYEANSQNTIKRSLWRIFDYYNFFTKYKIKEILLKEKPDLCHTNNIGGFSVSLWTTIKKLNYPLVHTIRDYYTICATSKMLNNNNSCNNQCFKCKVYTYNKKVTSQKIDAVIGVSKFILEKHLEKGYFTNAKIKTYIYNPIEFINEDFVKEKSTNIRFGYLGLISPIKGVEQLLKIFTKIKNKNIRLYLAGKEYKEGYINHLKNKFNDKRIEFMGFIEPEKFFKKIDVLIHPALWNEPFARSIIESYSYKTPVIASKKGGNVEAVINGKTGYLFSNINEFEKYLNYFINNPSQIVTMQQNCLMKTKDLLVYNIVQQYVNIYNRLID